MLLKTVTLYNGIASSCLSMELAFRLYQTTLERTTISAVLRSNAHNLHHEFTSETSSPRLLALGPAIRSFSQPNRKGPPPPLLLFGHTSSFDMTGQSFAAGLHCRFLLEWCLAFPLQPYTLRYNPYFPKQVSGTRQRSAALLPHFRQMRETPGHFRLWRVLGDFVVPNICK